MTLPASNITATNATLNALVGPNSLATVVYFAYGLTTNYGFFSDMIAVTNNLSFTHFVSSGVTNLLPGAIYHFQALATNAVGTNYGGDLTFTNPALAPFVLTLPATNITATTAMLSGLLNAGGAPTTFYFQYGLTTNYGSVSPNQLLTTSLNGQLTLSNFLTSLTPGSVYHFQAVATNAVGTNYGGDLTFTNPFGGTLPYAFTAPATLANGASAQMNGFASANGSPGYAWFEWGTSVGYGVTTPLVAVGTNFSVAFVTNRITGLFTNLPYHFRLVVSNGLGVAYGYDQIFDQANIVAWGADYAGQTTPLPAGLTNLVTSLGAGYENSLALNTDGTVVAWGINTFRQTNVPAGLNTAVAVAGGDRHSLAMRSNRTVIAWGSNQFGQTNSPTNLTNIVGIAAGGTHNLALRTNGTVVAWGGNSYGQTNVPASATNVVSVSAGELHSLALRNNGTVVAWGYNVDGETNVPPNLTNVVAIAAGGYHSLALKQDGTVVAWGYNADGETNVPGGLVNVIAIAAGGYHSLALKNDGSIVAWGDNSALQTTLPLGMSNVVAMVGGGLHSLALSSIYGLNQTNTAPFWVNGLAGSTVTMNEKTTLLVTNTALDTDIPLQALSYALLTNALPWVTINAQGVIRLLPLETNGPSTNVITTVVTDNGRPALSSTNSFTLIVNEVNSAPFWPTNVPSQTNYVVNELTLLTVTNTANDSDIPTNLLNYSVSVSPLVTGVAISTNGIITWAPPEVAGPGIYTLTTIVTDNGSPALSATNSFTVAVNEVNTPPQFILTPTNPPVAIGVSLVITNAATDADVPTNVLVYSLLNPPPGASVDTNSGVLTLLLPPGTNVITTVVTDTNPFALFNQTLSATNVFSVIVYPAPAFTSVVWLTNGVSLQWSGFPSEQFQVQWTTNLAPLSWTLFPDLITSTNGTFNFVDTNAPLLMKFYQLILLP